MKAHERLEKQYDYGRRASDIRVSREIRLRRHWLQELPTFILFLVISVCGYYASIRHPWSVQYFDILTIDSLSVTIPVPFFALLPLIFIFVIIYRLYDTVFVISLDHVRLVEGICSVSSTDTRIDYENVRGIEIDRNLFQRIFNLGTLKIGSSMHSGVEVEMKGVYNPSRFRQIIENRIRIHFEKLSRNTMVERVRKMDQQEVSHVA